MASIVFPRETLWSRTTQADIGLRVLSQTGVKLVYRVVGTASMANLT